RLVRFVPFPVVAGFLDATGWLLLTGAVGMTIGEPLSWQTLLDWHTLVMPSATVLWAAVLWALTARWKHPLLLPLALIVATLATHAVLATLRVPGDAVAAWSLMFSLQEGVRPVIPLLSGDYARAEWTALVPVAGDMVAVAVLAILSILLNSTSIEL